MSARLVFILALAVVLHAWVFGCANTRTATQPGMLFGPRGMEWTILCITQQGPDRRAEVERVARTLRWTPGIKAKQVHVRHGTDISRLYYGAYFRLRDKETGRLVIPNEMRNDMALLKDLAGPGGGRFFYDARVVPAHTPDVGNPDWELGNNPGVYTLRVAIFFDEPGLTERKKAAAAYCEVLRDKGYEAYYRHGEITSEVMVGSFPADALDIERKRGVLISRPGKKVREVQKDENLRYETWNLKRRSVVTGDRKALRSSRLIPVRAESDVLEEDFY